MVMITLLHWGENIKHNVILHLPLTLYLCLVIYVVLKMQVE